MAPPSKKKGDREDKEEIISVDDDLRTSRRLRRIQKDPNRIDAGTILDEAKKVDFMQKEQAEGFKIKYNESLLNRKSPGASNNVLHALAGSKDWTPEKIRSFLDWLLKEYHGLLERKDVTGYGPLHQALMNTNDAFVNAVLSYGLKNLGKVLALTCPYGTSLHVAIEYESPAIQTMVDKCKSFPGIFKQGTLGSENTPLHIAMDVDEEELERFLQKHHLIHEENPPAELPEKLSEITRLAKIDTVDRRRPNQPEQIPSEWTVVDGERHTAYPISPLQIVELLVTACPDALELRNVKGRTPYQEREYQLRNSEIVKQALEKVKSKDNVSLSELQETAFRRIFVEDPIALYIRYYCVREFDRDKIMTCLYQPGEGKHSQRSSVGVS